MTFLRFEDDRGASLRRRLDRWLGLRSHVFPIDFRAQLEGGGWFTERRFRSGKLGIAHTETPRMLLSSRPRVRFIDKLEALNLRYVTGGASLMVVDDHAQRMTPGTVYIQDGARPLRMISDNMAWLSISIPYESVGYDPRRHPPVFALRPQDKGHRRVVTMLSELSSPIPTLSEDEMLRRCHQLFDLLRGLLGLVAPDDRSMAALRQARREELFAWIEQNLTRDKVQAKTLEEQFGLSRATLYRMFEPYGGLARYITQRRLERAFAKLADAPPARGLISRTAKEAGFDDPLHFSRNFRRAFGVTPSKATRLGALHNDDTC